MQSLPIHKRNTYSTTKTRTTIKRTIITTGHKSVVERNNKVTSISSWFLGLVDTNKKKKGTSSSANLLGYMRKMLPIMITVVIAYSFMIEFIMLEKQITNFRERQLIIIQNFANNTTATTSTTTTTGSSSSSTTSSDNNATERKQQEKQLANENIRTSSVNTNNDTPSIMKTENYNNNDNNSKSVISNTSTNTNTNNDIEHHQLQQHHVVQKQVQQLQEQLQHLLKIIDEKTNKFLSGKHQEQDQQEQDQQEQEQEQQPSTTTRIITTKNDDKMYNNNNNNDNNDNNLKNQQKQEQLQESITTTIERKVVENDDNNVESDAGTTTTNNDNEKHDNNDTNNINNKYGNNNKNSNNNKYGNKDSYDNKNVKNVQQENNDKHNNHNNTNDNNPAIEAIIKNHMNAQRRRKKMRLQPERKKRIAIHNHNFNKYKNITLFKYLSTIGFVNKAVLLVWDKDGKLVRTSPIDTVDWLPTKSIVTFFDNAGKSKYGKIALLINANVLYGLYGKWDIVPPVPVLTYTLPNEFISNNNNTNSTTNLHVLPSPYDRDGYTRFCTWQAEQVRIPYEERKNIIIWRGTPHKLKNRIKLLEMAKEQENDNDNKWLDAVNIADDPSQLLERSDMAEYKYQLDIGGESGTTWGGLRWKMCSGNLVFKVASWSQDWWHNTIQPWKHYIPVKEDLSDLRERYEWAERHPQDAYQIMQQGRQVCKKSLTEAAVERYHHNIMQSLPSSLSQDIVKEAYEILDGEVPFWKDVNQSTAFDRSKVPVEQFKKEVELQSSPEELESLPAAIPADGNPSTSIYRYLEAAYYPHFIAILKWNASGILDRVSPLDIPTWFPEEGRKHFERTKPSKFGSVAFLLNTDVMAAVPWDTTPPIPLITYTLPNKCENNAKFILVPSPYDRESFNRACIRHAEEVTLKIPFHERKNVIVWRGITHGKSDPNRNILFEMSKADPDNEWLDAENIEEDKSKFLERDEMSKWKYQLDIGGESGTTWGSLRWKMCSGNLVFKVDSWARDWWHDTIEPWWHYIPVKEDLSDLREQYEWAESHPKEVNEIITRAVRTCKASVAEEAVAAYHEKVMRLLPPASEELVIEADAILDGVGSFYETIIEKPPDQ